MVTIFELFTTHCDYRPPVGKLLCYSGFVLYHQYKHLVPKSRFPRKMRLLKERSRCEASFNKLWIHRGIDWAKQHVRVVDVSIKCLQFKPTIEGSLANKAKWTTCNHKGQASRSQESCGCWCKGGTLESDVWSVLTTRDHLIDKTFRIFNNRGAYCLTPHHCVLSAILNPQSVLVPRPAAMLSNDTWLPSC